MYAIVYIYEKNTGPMYKLANQMRLLLSTPAASENLLSFIVLLAKEFYALFFPRWRGTF